ncbi:uncharacterized protein CELE_C49F5.13 [Caenorhabditis elegans]|uniref:Uncharacterized protein n=1 Tax=Caenorhabditis elegans TaxID=6239 RepID=A0A0S4XR61_CAEEL|nr:Uncharacterized protein CELE_C49F5.13 [Caenorhabditis elegans]CUV67114.1 Uncharacterized protein CELE_C49F5.13 [Caenorhabditis elegans]|eukprot:NP_001305198.1 Uncharacterized protein CELE_C49F5.13 [Caenorhabditis elegans]
MREKRARAIGINYQGKRILWGLYTL